MFEGTVARVQLFSPDASRQAKAVINDTGLEFDDVTFQGGDGSPISSLGAQIDIFSSFLRVSMLEAGTFSGGNDAGDFHGYKVTLTALAGDRDVSLRSADLIGYSNTVGLDQADVETRGNAVLLTMNGQQVEAGDSFEIRLNLEITGDNGNDLLLGGAGNDVIRGGGRMDILNGGGGRDRIDGGRGADLIDGGAGRDVLIGGRGIDTFIFGSFRGRDTVKDFTLGEDRLFAYGADDFDDLTFRDTKNGALIRAGNGAILIEGVEADALTSDIFAF